MKPFFYLLIFLVPFLSKGQTTVVLQPDAYDGKDALLHGLVSESDRNYGTMDFFMASSWTFKSIPGNIRSLIEFDIKSNVPSDATIVSATIKLHGWDDAPYDQYHSIRSGSNTGWIKRVTESWAESTVTWNTKPTTSNVGQITIPMISDPNADHEIVVTEMVQDMHQYPETNFGFQMELKTEVHYRSLSFCSSDHENPLKRPKLTIVYTQPELVEECPLDIGESTLAPTTGLSLHLPLNGDLSNIGSGNFIASNSGATYVNGVCGQGLEFDGVDDYLQISPSLDPRDDYTFTAWIKTNNQPNEGMGVFGVREQCSNTYRGYALAQLNFNYGATGFNYQVNKHQNCSGFSGGDRYNDDQMIVPEGEATFVVVKVENNSSEDRIVTMYINCEEFVTKQEMDHSTNETFNPVRTFKTAIGALTEVAPFRKAFDGMIDEIRFYDSALDKDSILKIYHSCVSLEMNTKELTSCSGDETIITLSNTQSDVRYQLKDITNNQLLGAEISGNCNSEIEFSTGIYTSDADFEIIATHETSNCSKILSAVIQLRPTFSYNTVERNSSICPGDSVFINNRYITEKGVYIDTISQNGQCDSIITTIVLQEDIPMVELGTDKVICEGTSINLKPEMFLGEIFKWSNGSYDKVISIDQVGDYWLDVSNKCGSDIDSVSVRMDEIPSVDLGEDQTVCSDEIINFNVSGNFETIVWQDSSLDSSMIVNEEGIYSVTVSNQCGFSKDSVKITFEDCTNSEEGDSCTFFIPNSFSPNGDYINDEFGPISSCVIKNYSLKIFGRTDMKVFESDNIEKKWNGVINKRKALSGMYVYVLTYQFSEELIKERIGNLLIID